MQFLKYAPVASIIGRRVREPGVPDLWWNFLLQCSGQLERAYILGPITFVSSPGLGSITSLSDTLPRKTPLMDTTQYCQQAGSRHPAGMHSCSFISSHNACYRPQRSWGKVMFLHVSVILFTGGGSRSLSQGVSIPEGGSRGVASGEGSASGSGSASMGDWANPFISDTT